MLPLAKCGLLGCFNSISGWGHGFLRETLHGSHACDGWLHANFLDHLADSLSLLELLGLLLPPQAFDLLVGIYL